MGIRYLKRKNERYACSVCSIAAINGHMPSWVFLGSQHGAERGLTGLRLEEQTGKRGEKSVEYYVNF